jgi:hypothetical protein
MDERAVFFDMRRINYKKHIKVVFLYVFEELSLSPTRGGEAR